VQTLIFTYYSEESSQRFIPSIKSVASNLQSSQNFELIIIAKRPIPTKVINAVSPYFLTVTHIRPAGRVINFSKDCAADVITRYRENDRWFISPNLIITSELESQPELNVFYQNSDSSISTKLFYIKAGSVIPAAISSLIDSRPATQPSYELTSSDLSFTLTNNFLIQKIIPKKPILSKAVLIDSVLDYTDLSTVIALDTTDCFGSRYSNLNQTISDILQKQKKSLATITKKKSTESAVSSIDSSASLSSQSFGNIVRDSNRVSVIMTNYNCENFLERAIKSVLSQTHNNLELIIVDDASTDGSLAIIDKFAQTDSRVRVFKNLKQRGTYWAKNSVIDKTTGSYITMIDSDDYDVPTRLEKQLAGFTSPEVVCVTCLNDRKVSEFSNVSERVSMGYPSMMFRHSVFSNLGYYDTVRFGADSEFYERVRLEYGGHRIKRVNEVLQISPRRTNGLTGVIPEMSQPRLEYVRNYTKWHTNSTDRYIKFPQKSRKFPIPTASNVTYSDLSNSIVVRSKSTSTLPVIMCVWKRVDGFSKTIDQLNSQKFKDFKLFVWNNNPELTDKFRAILNRATFEYEFYTSSENIGGFGRFKYAKQIRRNPGLMDHCVFIDDDQEFGPELLSTFIREAKPNTIFSQWGWEFTRLWYYGNDARRQRLPGETIHYAGTGGMVVDMRVFDSEGLFDCPEQYWFVEDLWLSFYANHNLGFKLLKSAAVMKNGDDIHSLYRVVKDVKSPMLIDLVTNYGWSILPKPDTDSPETTTTTTTIDQIVSTPEPSPVIEIEPAAPSGNRVVKFLSKIIKM